jgi:hypothetical protein
MPEKKRETEFVVTDRRKFTTEGEVRPEASPREESTAAAEDALPSAPLKNPPVAEPGDLHPPTDAQQHAQKKAYEQSGRDLDDVISKAGHGGDSSDMVMTFERLLQSLYMTALMQLGLLREKEEPQERVDIIGARQTIDTLAILQEKTQGNLSAGETRQLQTALFELRMAFLEVTNAITRMAKAPTTPKHGPHR